MGRGRCPGCNRLKGRDVRTIPSVIARRFQTVKPTARRITGACGMPPKRGQKASKALCGPRYRTERHRGRQGEAVQDAGARRNAAALQVLKEKSLLRIRA